jgi:NAD(P)H-flavin reductase
METKNIITTLERKMKCAIGVCGHCHFEDELIRADGAVFQGSELSPLEKL